MTAAAAAGLGPPRGRREVVDVVERKPADRRLDQLLNVRKQRLSRLERERNDARRIWQQRRQKFRTVKQRWHDAVLETQRQWQQSRQEFLAMAITNGQFRRAKAVYERMKKETAQLYLECQNELRRCREAGTGFFVARQRVLDANRQQEKLTIMRDEMRALALAGEE